MVTKSKKTKKVKSEKKVTKKNKVDLVKIKVKKKTGKESPHLINLKNPKKDLFEELKNQKGKKTKLTSRINVLTPGKVAPITAKKPGVNFISTKKLEPYFFNAFKKQKKVVVPIQKFKPKEDDIEDIFATPTNLNYWRFGIPRNWYKKIAVFIVVSLVLILPLQAFTYFQDLKETKDRILSITDEAIENLKLSQKAAFDLDLDSADTQLGRAKENFSLAQKEVNNLNFLTTEILKLLPGKNKSVQTGIKLLEAGEIISDTGQILISSGKSFLAGGGLKDYYNTLVQLEVNLKIAVNNFQQAKIRIESIKPSDLPTEHRGELEKIKTYMPEVEKGLTDLYFLNKSLLKILGQNQWQRYLLVFLNNNEIRGGGGFMGSFALLDVDRGEIKDLEVPGGGTYDLRAAFKPKIISPEPLHLINPHWEFQDANWWSDYPTTAKKIRWFYENAEELTVDGVISITSTMMERLLDIFGPISMPEYGREITSQNFVLETQKIVQLEYDKEENRPKKFIGDLTPKLLDRVFSADKAQLEQLIRLIKETLNEKHLLVYFSDSQLENLISDFGWSGEIKHTSGDYLSVVHTNLAGGKTDSVIKETITHQAEIQPDGSIINTVKLTRHHNGVRGEDVFTGVQNNSYVRFYVPSGSTLISATGFEKPPAELFKDPDQEYQPDLDLITTEKNKIFDEATGTDIYKEANKTVFGNWLQLQAGEVQEATIKYRLPFKLLAEGENTYYYSILIQKQPGNLGSELKSILKLNDKLKILAKFPADLPSEEQELSFSSNLITDQFYGAVLTNK